MSDLSLQTLRDELFGGEIELCVEFPKTFGEEIIFLNFCGDSTINPFYRDDAASIEFFCGAVSLDPLLQPRGLPANLSAEAQAEFAIHAGELI